MGEISTHHEVHIVHETSEGIKSLSNESLMHVTISPDVDDEVEWEARNQNQ